MMEDLYYVSYMWEETAKQINMESSSSWYFFNISYLFWAYGLQLLLIIQGKIEASIEQISTKDRLGN